MDEPEAGDSRREKRKLLLISCVVIGYTFASIKLLCFLLITLMILPVFILGKYSKAFNSELRFDFKIKRLWSRLGLAFCRLKVEAHGDNTGIAEVYVSNHISWLDILVLQSFLDISFVAKAEVRGWFGLGYLARLADTIFIRRKVMAAKEQHVDVIDALNSRKKICFFPEGTSSNGSTILPFKSSLFEVFVKYVKSNGEGSLSMQPITILYEHSDLQRPFIYGWWGDMSLVPHIFDVLSTGKAGTVKLIFHARISDISGMDRKTLCNYSEKVIRSTFYKHV